MSAVTVAVHLLVVCMTISQVASQQFEIVQNRFNTNVVRLRCHRTDFGPLGSTIFFFRNNSAGLSTTNIVHSEDGTGLNSVEYIFLVNRLANEGMYSCGETTTGPDSNQVPVIAYPEHDFQVEFDGVTTIRARAGSTAVLPPYITPGNWHSRYYIDWYNDGHLVGRIVGLRSQSLITTQYRFSVDPASFSLTINNVASSDIGEYFGMLQVTQGENYDGLLFSQTENMAIRLEVYEGPVIRMENEKVVIKKKKSTDTLAVFECAATGYPRPTIHWTHQLSSDSQVESMNDETSNSTARSILRISNAHSADSGKVGCYAVVNPGGNVAPLVSETVEGELSVLEIFQVKVYRTTGNELVFIVHLGSMVSTGLRIQLHGSEEDNTYTSPEEYKGINPITYIFSNYIQGSTVSVVVVDSEGHETSEPFSVDLSALEQINIPSDNSNLGIYLGLSGVVLLLIVFLVAIVLFICITKKKKINLQRDTDPASDNDDSGNELSIQHNLSYGHSIQHNLSYGKLGAARIHEYDCVDFPLTVNADLSINTRNPAYSRSIPPAYRVADDDKHDYLQTIDGSQPIPPVDAGYGTVEDIVCQYQKDPIYATIGEPSEEIKQNSVYATIKQSYQENSAQQTKKVETQEMNLANTVHEATIKEPGKTKTVQQHTTEDSPEDDTAQPSGAEEPTEQKKLKQNDIATLEDADLDAEMKAAISWLDEQCQENPSSNHQQPSENPLAGRSHQSE